MTGSWGWPGNTSLLLSCRNYKIIVYTNLHGVQYNLHKTKSPPCAYTVLYLDTINTVYTSLDCLLKQIMSKDLGSFV